VGFALLRERTDPRVRSRQVLVETIGAEPLVELGSLTTAPALPAETDPTGMLASNYRRLRVTVWPRRGLGPNRVLITTPVNGNAAEAVACNLALTAQRAGWRTLVAWMDRPDASPLLRDVDFSDTEHLDPAEAPLEKLLLTAPGHEHVSLLPELGGRATAGTAVDEIADRLSELDGQFDVEMIVTAPALASPEAYELAPAVDGSILVFDISRDTKADLEKAIESLTATGTPIVGVVTVGTPSRW
jgi:Mrp family chromosome partitioning ATPase